MFLAAILIWIVFGVRDLCLLQMGSPRQFGHRIRIYSASFMFTAIALAIALLAEGPTPVTATLCSPWLVGSAIACHLLFTALCGWLVKRGRFESGWLISLVPAPTPWIVLVIAGRMLFPGDRGLRVATLVLFVATVWLLLVAGGARLANRAEGSAEELDFSVRFAAWSNSMAFCLVPLIVQGN